MIKNKSHWNNFYKKFKLKKSSNFAKFVFRNGFINKKSKIIEVGCGNGRDTFFFMKRRIRIISLDKSDQAIKVNKANFKNVFLKADVCNFTNQKLKYFKTKYEFNVIYARFFLHTLNYEDEKKIFFFCNNIINEKGLLLLEFRTIKDPLMKKGRKISKTERVTDHYRRFIESKQVINSLKNNFKLIYKTESFGLARFKDENPHICRLIFKKIK